MVGLVAGSRAGAAAVPSHAMAPMQTIDPTVVTEMPGPIRGAVAFVGVLLLGLVLVRRFGGFLDRAIQASMARPLWAVGYGLAGHAVVGFGSVYLASQLAQLPTGGWYAGVVGVGAGLFLYVVASSLGFTVVGTVVATLRSEEPWWAGPLVGALLAGGAAFIPPPVGWLTWFVVVSIGIGGPVRKWLHASEGPDPADVRRG